MSAVTTPRGEKPQPPGRGAGGRGGAPSSTDTETGTESRAPHTGGMIALIPSREDLDKLVIEGGEPLEELHLTITYLGENVAESLDQATRAAMLTDVAAMAAGMPPIEAEVMGHGSFNPSGGDDGQRTPCAVYLVSGAAELPILYEDLGSYASEDAHPIFLPHITAGYNLDVSKLSYTGPIRFEHVRIALGDQVSDIALSGQPEAEDLGGDDAVDDAEFAADDPAAVGVAAAGPDPLDQLDDEGELEDDGELLDDLDDGPIYAPAPGEAAPEQDAEEPDEESDEEPAEEEEPADGEGLPDLDAEADTEGGDAEGDADDADTEDISPEEVAEAEAVDGEEPADDEAEPEEGEEDDEEEEEKGAISANAYRRRMGYKAVAYSTNDRIAASAADSSGKLKGTYAAGKTKTQIQKEKEAEKASKAKRKVASKAGEARYGLPIGTELGQSRGGKAADDARNDKRGAELYDAFRGKSAADQKKYLASLNDDDAKKLHALLYSVKSSNEAVVAARVAASADLKRRGIDPGQHGSLAGKGGPAKAPAKAKAKAKAPAKGVAAKYAGRSSVDYGKIPESDWDALLKAGWKGKAGDGAERLYPPGAKSGIPLSDTTWYLDDGDWMQRRARRMRAGLQGRPGSRIPRRRHRVGEYKQLLTLHVFPDTSWSYK